MTDAIQKAREALVAAREWLEGWASADKQLAKIDAALDAETEVKDTEKPAHVCRWCDGLGSYNCFCTGYTTPEARS